MPEKVGRNQLCPCGSGVKYKKCCGIAVQVPGTDEGPGGANRYGVIAHEDGEYLHIVMPTRGLVTIETLLAVAGFGWSASDYSRLGVSRVTFLPCARKPVAEAREILANAILKGMEAQPKATHWVLWLDDDAAPTQFDVIALLAEARRNPDIGVLSCFYSPKVKNHPGWVPKFGSNENFLQTPGVDFPPDCLVEVPWVGLHCAIMRGEVLTKIEEPRFPCDPTTGVGEDVGFSHKVREAGYALAVHAGVMVKHIDGESGDVFLPDVGAKRIVAATS